MDRKKRQRDAQRVADRLAAQAVRCWCGAKPGERCRTGVQARFPRVPTTTHQRRVTGYQKLLQWEGRGR